MDLPVQALFMLLVRSFKQDTRYLETTQLNHQAAGGIKWNFYHMLNQGNENEQYDFLGYIFLHKVDYLHVMSLDNDHRVEISHHSFTQKLNMYSYGWNDLDAEVVC